MPTRFEELDKATSAAVDRLLAEAIIWRPVARSAGGTYTTRADRPDETRPVRTLQGIPSWAPTISQLSTSSMGGGGIVGNVQCSVDFDVGQFGDGPRPRAKDRFELPGEPASTRHLVVIREGEASANRVSYHCSITGAPAE